MENNTVLSSEEETTNSTDVTSQFNHDMAVVNGSEKKGHTKSNDVQPLSDQHLSATPDQSLTKTPNSNAFLKILKGVENVKSSKQIELHMRLLSVVEVNSEPENEEVELMQPPSHPDLDLSATPVQSLIITANTTTMNNGNDLKSPEETKKSITDTTQSILTMAAGNGSSKLEQFQSHTDQELPPNPFWLNTKNSTELLAILKKIKDFKQKEQIEPHSRLTSDPIVNPGSENKENELKQSPSLVNQEYSKAPVQFLTKAANSATTNNITKILSKEETTDSISATTQANSVMTAVNGSAKKEHTKSEELKLHLDQDLSATPVQSLTKTADTDESSEILKKVDGFEHKEQIKPHQGLRSDENVNPGPANKEGEFMQSPSTSRTNHASAPPENSKNPSEGNNSSQKEPYVRNEVTRKSIFIGNVDYSVNARDLLHVFSVCGPINRVTILNDFVVSLPRGYAFIEFVETNSVQLSLTMNNIKINGREVTVQQKNMNEYGLRSNRRHDIVLIQLMRVSMTILTAVYSSLMFPKQKISMTFYTSPHPIVPMPMMPFPAQQNGPVPMMPFPAQQNGPVPMMPFPMQQNVPMPTMPIPEQNMTIPTMVYAMPNMYYGMQFF